MASTILNLGQIAAVKVAATAPTNKQLLWYDTSVTSGINWKYFNLSTSQWETLGSNGSNNIIDDNVLATIKTWSSQKINTVITDQTKTKTLNGISLRGTGDIVLIPANPDTYFDI